MNKKVFWIIFTLILLFGLVLRLYPAQNYNFYFTIDQGDEAVNAREFFERGRLLITGPETGIRGVHAGPLWYYFVSIGYKIFNGDPFGALLMVILLNLVVTGVIVWQIRQNVSPYVALLIGVALQFYWFFYDTSRWSFNPFPLVFLSFALIFLLTSFLRGRLWSYILASVIVGLAFNAEVAGAAAMLIFYILVGACGYFKQKIGIKIYLVAAFFIPSIFLLKIVYEFGKVYWKHRSLPESTMQTFGGVNYFRVGVAFLEIVRDATIPQSMVLGVLVFLAVLGLYFWKGKGNRGRGREFVNYYVVLCLVLYLVSLLFLGMSRGFRDWHDIFLPPLLFVSVLLMLFSSWGELRGLKVRYYKWACCVFGIVILISQFWLFQERYREYLKPSDDPGLLINQIKVVDWVYQSAENDGFNAYVYTPNKHDDHYQYVFWWYARQTYRYLPCEYSYQRAAIKYLYIPSAGEYSEPKLGCDRHVFLIMEPFDFAQDKPFEAQGKPDFEKWYEEARVGTYLVEEKLIGRVKVEKRRYKK